MSNHEIVIIDGVRFRKDDADRLGLKGNAKARAVDPAPVTTTAAQHTAQLAAQQAADTQAAADALAAANTEAAKIIADAHAAAAAIKEGAGNGGEVPGTDNGSGDSGETAGVRSKGRTGTKASQ